MNWGKKIQDRNAWSNIIEEAKTNKILEYKQERTYQNKRVHELGTDPAWDIYPALYHNINKCLIRRNEKKTLFLLRYGSGLFFHRFLPKFSSFVIIFNSFNVYLLHFPNSSLRPSSHWFSTNIFFNSILSFFLTTCTNSFYDERPNRLLAHYFPSVSSVILLRNGISTASLLYILFHT